MPAADMILFPESVAYCAGLFEGEGFVGLRTKYYKRNGDKTPRREPLIEIRINMTDVEPLIKFAHFLGGVVYGPYEPKGKLGSKLFYTADVHGFESCQAAIAAMWKWLSPRRKEQCLKILRGYHAGRSEYNSIQV